MLLNFMKSYSSCGMFPQRSFFLWKESNYGLFPDNQIMVCFQIVMWINQNFLLQEDVQVDASGSINFAFMSLRGTGPFHFKMDPSGMVRVVLFIAFLHSFVKVVHDTHLCKCISVTKQGIVYH